MTDATNTTNTTAVESVDESAQDIAAEQGGQSSALALIDSMNKPGLGIYSSITGTNFADKIKVVEALSNSVAIDPDHIGTVINLKDFIAQAIKINDTVNGGMIDAARVILIDEDGTSYHATSVGLASALRTLVQVVGEPATWEAPIPVTVAVQKTRANFRVFTLNYV
jgi:hypothetical protein